MRVVPLILGVLLLLAGIVLAGIFFATGQTLYAYLIIGVVLILVGLLFLWFSARIPKIQTVKPVSPP